MSASSHIKSIAAYNSNMAIIRQYIAPLLAILVFTLALVAVSARIFLPSDMAAPAPIEEVGVSLIPNSELPFTQLFAQS